MIQRIQSLWLLLAAVAMFLVIKLPFAIQQSVTGQKEITVDANLPAYILAILLSVGALIIIFLFKKRANQKRLIWLGILASVLFIVLMYLDVENAKNTAGNSAHFRIGAICPILYIIFMIMAHAGIRRDEKLIKSVDRLR